jgi:hypothetical protein
MMYNADRSTRIECPHAECKKLVFLVMDVNRNVTAKRD